jgi:hypothetical protein
MGSNPIGGFFENSCHKYGQFIYTKLTICFPTAGTVKETIAPICEETEEDIKALLKGTDVAWAQYKRCHGTKVTDTKELDEFLDSL